MMLDTVLQRILVLAFLCASCATAVESSFSATLSAFSTSELDALQAIYNATDGDHWTWEHPYEVMGFPWNFSQPHPNPCVEFWQGVLCTPPSNISSTQHVMQLNLSALSMIGELPPEVGNFSDMASLIIWGNLLLVGTIPEEIGLLTSLEYLELRQNSFVGTLPPSIGNLTKLIDMRISVNYFNSPLPDELVNLHDLRNLEFSGNLNFGGTFPQMLLSMPWLESLDLNENELYGSLPEDIGVRLPALQLLSLTDNKFVGSLPESMGQMSSLRILDLNSNFFTSTFPHQLLNISTIEALTIGGNRLNGTLPLVTSLVWPNLELLDVSYNNFTGGIPSTLLTFSSLIELDLSYNPLGGRLPSNMSSLAHLTLFTATHCELTGPLPLQLPSIYLSELTVMENFLTSTIPSTYSSLVSLTKLSLDHNMLSGELPTYLDNWPGLDELTANENLFSGSIPSEIFGLSHLYILRISENSFTGSIPSSLTTGLTMQEFLAERNFLTGSLPQSLLNHINDLSLGTNLLTGPVTLAQGSTVYLGLILCRLDNNFLEGNLNFLNASYTAMEYLNVSNNYFSGNIEFLSDFLIISDVDVSYNHITGTLPDFSLNSDLATLFAERNSFTGNLERFLDRVPHSAMEMLDLSKNSLTGSIPDVIGRFNNLLVFAAVENCLTGTLPDAFCNDSSLIVLALDGVSTAQACREYPLGSLSDTFILKHAAVHGTIPSCLFSMNSLHTLHLSGNRLHGTLPELNTSVALGNLLADLSLSHNLLSGTIPRTLQGGSRWENMDVSFNKLTGALCDDCESWNTSATVSYRLNHLSGRIPSNLYSLQDIQVLEGNIFTCDQRSDGRDDVPRGDEYEKEYTCDSQVFNSSLIVWVVVAAAVAGMAWIIFGPFHPAASEAARSLRTSNAHQPRAGTAKQPTEDVELATFSADTPARPTSSRTYSAVDSAPLLSALRSFIHRIRTWKEGFLDPLPPTEGNGIDPVAFHSVHSARLLFSQVIKLACCIGILIVLLAAPLYIGLNQFYGRYQHSYAWTVSAGYLGGSSPAITLLFFFTFFLLVTAGLRHYYEAHVEGTIVKPVSLRPSSFRQTNGMVPPPPTSAADPLSPSHRPTFVHSLAVLAGSLLRRSPQETSPAAASPDADTEEVKNARSSTSNILSIFRKENYFLIAKAICLALSNIILVVFFNGLFVYASLHSSYSVVVIMAISLSIFKIVWGRILIIAIKKYLFHAVTLRVDETVLGVDAASPSMTRHDPLSETSTISPLRSSHNSSQHSLSLGQSHALRFTSPTFARLDTSGRHVGRRIVRYYSLLMIFNTIVAPCVATAIANSDCFYYFFSSAPSVTTSYGYRDCEFRHLNHCDKWEWNMRSYDFDPPFVYSYQCSSSILVEYAYVFAYKYIILGLLYPTAVLCMTYWVDTCSEESRKTSWFYYITWLLPSLYRRGTYGYKLKTMMREVLSVADISVRLLMMFATLLTFGLVMPLLAVLIVVSVATNLLLTCMGLNRVLRQAARYEGAKDRELEILHIECQRIYPAIELAANPVIIVVPLFLGLFIFDTEGNAKGSWRGFYVLLAFWLFPLVLLTARRLVWLAQDLWGNRKDALLAQKGKGEGGGGEDQTQGSSSSISQQQMDEQEGKEDGEDRMTSPDHSSLSEGWEKRATQENGEERGSSRTRESRGQSARMSTTFSVRPSVRFSTVTSVIETSSSGLHEQQVMKALPVSIERTSVSHASASSRSTGSISMMRDSQLDGDTEL